MEEEVNKNKKYDESVFKLNREIAGISIQEKPLVCKGITKKYKQPNGTDNYVALKPFNLYIEPNEIYGLLGPNGAGKTTLISVLTGMYGKT